MKKTNPYGKVEINAGGGPVFMDKVDNRGDIHGRSDNHYHGVSTDDAIKIFDALYRAIDTRKGLTNQDKTDLKSEIDELRQEFAKKDQADETFLMRRLRNIGRMAPDILEVTLATITNPIAGFGVAAKKIADKFKASAG